MKIAIIMAISASGAVVFCTFDGIPDTDICFNQLQVFDNDVVRTLIPPTRPAIAGLSFLRTADREQLLVFHNRHLSLFDIDIMTRRGLMVFKCPAFPCSQSGGSKALYAKPAVVFDEIGDLEIRELQVTPYTCHESLKMKVKLGLRWVDDACIAEDFIIVSGGKSNGSDIVAGMSLSERKVKWIIPWEALALLAQCL